MYGLRSAWLCCGPSQFDKQIIEADGKVKVLKEELDKMVSKIGNIVDPRWVLG